MMEYARQPNKLFLKSVPSAFLRHALRCVVASYEQARLVCSDLVPREEARYLEPHCRRALIEAALREAATRFGQLAGSAERNPTGEFHTVLRIGPVLLTESHVDHPSRVVREARFRETYARDSQFWLFDEPKAPASDDALYAILIHGAANPTELHFARVVFPVLTVDGSLTYHRDQLDLLLLYPDVMHEPARQQETEAARELSLTLRAKEKTA